MTLLKNSTAKLITINTAMTIVKDENGKVTHAEPGKAYELFPAGESVEIPDEVVNTKYVKALIKSGDLVGGISVEEDEEDDDGVDKELVALREEADMLDIPYTGRWGKKKLQEEISKALED